MMDLEVLPEGVLIHALQENFVPGGVLALLSLRGLGQPFWSAGGPCGRQGRGIGPVRFSVPCMLPTSDCHPITAPG